MVRNKCEYTVSGKWFKYKKKFQQIISKNRVKIKHKLIRKMCIYYFNVCKTSRKSNYKNRGSMIFHKLFCVYSHQLIKIVCFLCCCS